MDSTTPSSPPLILNPLGLHVLETPTAGRGVFAHSDIAAGTVLEESPVLVLTKEEWELGRLNDGVLGSYGFNWGNGGMGVGLGLASMFNHSRSPNVAYTRLYPTRQNPNQRPTLVFRAFRSINKGEELFISYAANEDKLWFEKTTEQASVISAETSGRGSTSSRLERMTSLEQLSSAPLGALDFLEDEDEVEARAAADRKAQARRIAREAREGSKEKSPVHQSPSAASSPRIPSPLHRTHSNSENVFDSNSVSSKSVPQEKSKKTAKEPKQQRLSTSIPSPAPASAPAAHDDAYHAALAALDLDPPIDVHEEDIRREEEAIRQEPRVPDCGWISIKRIRGPVEDED